MDRPSLLEVARLARELTQEAVARRSGTSQPTLSAYERGTKSPTLAVAQRILRTLDFEIGLQPRVSFREVQGDHGRTYGIWCPTSSGESIRPPASPRHTSAIPSVAVVQPT